MVKLSVNLNKVALLRNSRSLGIPSVTRAARLCIDAGAQGITVHPRPDQRHIRPSDVYDLAELLAGEKGIEFNIEGNPFPEFMELVERVRPTQCTLVPDSPDVFTSDHGWNLRQDGTALALRIGELRRLGIRVSLFMDANPEDMELARAAGADRVELYTEPWAAAFETPSRDSVLARFAAASSTAQSAGLGVNAGHDLNLQNLGLFCSIPGILEVSIGHALTADALEMGFPAAVRAYLDVIRANAR
jgi:pyridoxine 5-phosphate synthase